MTTSMMLNKPSGSRWLKSLTGMIAVVLLAAALTACQTTHQVSESPRDFSGFLGDY